jgi:hypothetical protein
MSYAHSVTDGRVTDGRVIDGKSVTLLAPVAPVAPAGVGILRGAAVRDTTMPLQTAWFGWRDSDRNRYDAHLRGVKPGSHRCLRKDD